MWSIKHWRCAIMSKTLAISNSSKSTSIWLASPRTRVHLWAADAASLSCNANRAWCPAGLATPTEWPAPWRCRATSVLWGLAGELTRAGRPPSATACSRRHRPDRDAPWGARSQLMPGANKLLAAQYGKLSNPEYATVTEEKSEKNNETNGEFDNITNIQG